MGKLRKIVLVFFIIFIQSALAVTVGIVALSYASHDSFPNGAYIAGLDVGGLKKTDAAKKIKDYFDGIFSDGSLTIAIEGNGEYKIPYKDIDMEIDDAATVNSMEGWNTANYVPGLLKAYLGREKLKISPVLNFSEGKLRQKLIGLSKNINKAPVDASIYIENGQVAKRAETAGYILNVDNAVSSIRKCLNNNFGSRVQFNKKDNFEIQSVNPKIMLKEFNDIEQVISQYTTDINDEEMRASIKIGADAINGIILDGKSMNGMESGSFSFIECLKNADSDFANDNEGYDQVASTLYGALLEVGIDRNAITRLPHELAPEYIEAGLDAWISGNGSDLKFINTLEHKIILFAGIEGNKLTVRLAGNIRDKKQDFKIRVETVQKFDPPIVNIENKDLKPGEKVMLSPGKDGVMVKVYRNAELIGTDKYEAEKTIVQIGPGTDWNSSSNDNK